jgi:hypothetical protein
MIFTAYSVLVMATLAKRKRTKASIMVFSSIVEKNISKRSDHVYVEEFKYRSKANTFVSSKIYFEAKPTCLYVKI